VPESPEIHLGSIPLDGHWLEGGVLVVQVRIPKADAMRRIPPITVYPSRWISDAELERDRQELAAIQKRMARNRVFLWVVVAWVAFALLVVTNWPRGSGK
jgi:hypothetical protein